MFWEVCILHCAPVHLGDGIGMSDMRRPRGKPQTAVGERVHPFCVKAKAGGETVVRCPFYSGIGALVGSAGGSGNLGKNIHWFRLGRLERLPQVSDVSAELDTGSQRK